MTALASGNLALRFALELCMLAALAWAGYDLGGIVLAVVAPAVAATLWGLFVSPKAARYAGETVRALVEAAVFVAAAAGLIAAGRPALGIALGALALLSGTLARALPEPGWART